MGIVVLLSNTSPGKSSVYAVFDLRKVASLDAVTVLIACQTDGMTVTMDSAAAGSAEEEEGNRLNC